MPKRLSMCCLIISKNGVVKKHFDTLYVLKKFLRSEGCRFADNWFSEFGADEELSLRSGDKEYKIQRSREPNVSRRKI